MWHFKARPTRNLTSSMPGKEYVAWCAKTKNLGGGPLEVPLAYDCHFEFGATEEEALAKLRREVLN